MKKLILIMIIETTIMGLISGCVKEISTPISEYNDQEDPLTEMGNEEISTSISEYNYQENPLKNYAIRVMLIGKYKEYPPETFMGGSLCFYPDDTTASLIPRDDDDMRKVRFCFDNQELAKELLDINDSEIFSDTSIECIEGSATILISSYTVDRFEGATTDKATLESVISKEPYSTTCE